MNQPLSLTRTTHRLGKTESGQQTVCHLSTAERIETAPANIELAAHNKTTKRSVIAKIGWSRYAIPMVIEYQSNRVETEPALDAYAEPTLTNTLASHFGFEQFNPGQLAIISDVLSGRPTVAIMPTGAGKSLCYQLPAIILPGITIVVSPLISLMKDQVDSLNAKGIKAAYINSTQTIDRQNQILSGLGETDLELLYVAPERFRSNRFMRKLCERDISLVAIDEAHCISRWGHDFRPDYGRLGHVLEQLKPKHILACTATATPDVRQDIVSSLGLTQPCIHVAGFLRENLFLRVKRCRSEKERFKELLNAISDGHAGGKIIYSATRKRVEQIHQKICEFAPDLAVVSYHAGMDEHQRRSAQDEFMNGHAQVAIATNAFGMGIDRADIRQVIHMDLPRSIEGYYQEVGRAGRDGLHAECTLLFSPIDRRTHEFLIDLGCPSYGATRALYEALYAAGGAGLTAAGLAAQLTQIDKAQQESAARVLSRYGAICQMSPDGWRIAAHSPASFDDLAINFESFENRRRLELNRLDLMAGFPYESGCRHNFILSYFGEEISSDSCPGCDRCEALADRSASLSDADRVLVKKALAGIARADGHFGLTKVSKMLVGKRNGIEETPLVRLSTFALLKELGQKRCSDLLQALVDRGWASLTGGRYPRIIISPIGWEVMQGREDLTGLNSEWCRGPSTATRQPTDDPSVPSDGEVMVSGLKAFRLRLAKDAGVPAYSIFTNKSLNQMVLAPPTDESEFLNIHGLGTAKWAKFGAELINEIAKLTVKSSE
ncbi:MAG: recombinase RecQ [Myxococcales bacterium]|nr:recombinase RecQ [Myxococcales bacterium]